MNELTGRDFTEAAEPFDLFASWFAEAQKSEPNDPDAMALATVGRERPARRAHGPFEGGDALGLRVLQQRRKRQRARARSQPESRRRAALEVAAPSDPLSRRGRARERGRGRRLFRRAGRCKAASAPGRASNRARSKAASRSKNRSRNTPRNLRWGRFPRPPYWVGYRIKPVYLEFWSDGAFRLHDRIAFRRETPDAPWRKERLYP